MARSTGKGQAPAWLALALAGPLCGCSALFPAPAPAPALADGQASADGGLYQDGSEAVGGKDGASAADQSTGADAEKDVKGCDPAACPASADPCQVRACIGGACGHVPGTGGACDDLDPCTAGDACVEGKCQGGGARNWLSMFGKGKGGRLSDVVSGGGADLVAVGSDPGGGAAGAYDALWLRADGVGRQTQSVSHGVGESDDFVAVTRLADGSFGAVGFAAGTGRVVHIAADGAALAATAAELPGGGRFDDVAAPSGDLLVAVGQQSMNSTGPGVAQAFQVGGGVAKVAWTWTRTVAGKRVAAPGVAARKLDPAPSGVVVLGYDRTLPPGGSGPDLYDMWVQTVNASGKGQWLTMLATAITGAASGLVTRDDGSIVTLIDKASELELAFIDPGGTVQVLTTLPGGSIDTASDLAAAPDGGLFIARDAWNGPVTLLRLDAKGKLLVTAALTLPKAMRTRVLGFAALGGGAVALAGDVMLQANKSSSTSWRGFLRRVDMDAAAACPAPDLCFGDTHSCAQPAACQVPYCDGVLGCAQVALSPTVCVP